MKTHGCSINFKTAFCFCITANFAMDSDAGKILMTLEMTTCAAVSTKLFRYDIGQIYFISRLRIHILYKSNYNSYFILILSFLLIAWDKSIISAYLYIYHHRLPKYQECGTGWILLFILVRGLSLAQCWMCG